MSIWGFAFCNLVAIAIFILRERVTARAAMWTIVGLALSVPLFVLAFFVFKTLGVRPDKWLVITSYAAYLSLSLFAIMIFVARSVVLRVVEYQSQRNASDDRFILFFRRNTKVFIAMYSFVLLVGMIIAQCGLWLK